MENYKRYKENYPHKTDAQIIESLVWELKDKVETIHRLLAENEALRIHDVVGQSEQFISLIRELIDVGIIDEDDIEVETWVNNYLKEIN